MTDKEALENREAINDCKTSSEDRKVQPLMCNLHACIMTDKKATYNKEAINDTKTSSQVRKAQPLHEG